MGEVRYSSLVQSFPEEAAKLHKRLEDEYTERYATYRRMADTE
jgi:pyruvate-ferredoxin/flavodoxin oxidoreductase